MAVSNETRSTPKAPQAFASAESPHLLGGHAAKNPPQKRFVQTRLPRAWAPRLTPQKRGGAFGDVMSKRGSRHSPSPLFARTAACPAPNAFGAGSDRRRRRREPRSGCEAARPRRMSKNPDDPRAQFSGKRAGFYRTPAAPCPETRNVRTPRNLKHASSLKRRDRQIPRVENACWNESPKTSRQKDGAGA